MLIPSNILNVAEQVPMLEIAGDIVSTPEATDTGYMHVVVKLIVIESLSMSDVRGKVYV